MQVGVGLLFLLCIAVSFWYLFFCFLQNGIFLPQSNYANQCIGWLSSPRNFGLYQQFLKFLSISFCSVTVGYVWGHLLLFVYTNRSVPHVHVSHVECPFEEVLEEYGFHTNLSNWWNYSKIFKFWQLHGSYLTFIQQGRYNYGILHHHFHLKTTALKERFLKVEWLLKFCFLHSLMLYIR